MVQDLIVDYWTEAGSPVGAPEDADVDEGEDGVDDDPVCDDETACGAIKLIRDTMLLRTTSLGARENSL